MQSESLENAPDLLIANGIDATTGEYALPPMTPVDFKNGVKGSLVEPESKALKNWLKWRKERNFSLKEGLDPRKLEEAGWGIVFPVNTPPEIIEAMQPLMEWRRQQAGERFQVYSDNAKGAVRPMTVDGKGTWLARQGAENFGPVDPAKVPYYLLLVGDPAAIDYRFQYQLDVQYAVGRIHFDTPADYDQYARRVVQAEKESVRRRRQLAFFGVANEGDPATRLSERHLVRPLAEYTAGVQLKNGAPWEVQSILKEEATKARLNDLLRGDALPGLLFTASHGMGFPTGDARQMAQQGALLCQDWPGPSWRQPIPEDFYFSAADLPSDANLLGLVAFFFACYGAGTPQWDEFYRAAFKDRGPVAEKPFVARLPQKMLAQGALAVIGHVERAWGYSFVVDNALSLEAFRSSLHALMDGAPVGYAFEYFNERYAEFTTDLTEKIQQEDWNPVDPLEMATSWTATNDAKNYVVMGDPAVRVRVADAADAGPSVPQPVVLVSSAAASPEPPEASPAVVQPLPDPAAAAAALAEANLVQYGLGEDLAQLRANLNASLSQFAQKLSVFLGSAIDNAVTLDVSTYTSGDMQKVTVNGSQIGGAELRAVTLVRIDGDVRQVVPLDEFGAPDTALWALHVEMVRQAQASRAELVRAAVAAVSSLASLGAPK
jgi:hypothetical protein